MSNSKTLLVVVLEHQFILLSICARAGFWFGVTVTLDSTCQGTGTDQAESLIPRGHTERSKKKQNRDRMKSRRNAMLA